MVCGTPSNQMGTDSSKEGGNAGGYALHVASGKGRTDCVELLLNHKANPNRKDYVTRGEGLDVAHIGVGADSCIVRV